MFFCIQLRKLKKSLQNFSSILWMNLFLYFIKRKWLKISQNFLKIANFLNRLVQINGEHMKIIKRKEVDQCIIITQNIFFIILFGIIKQ